MCPLRPDPVCLPRQPVARPSRFGGGPGAPPFYSNDWFLPVTYGVFEYLKKEAVLHPIASPVNSDNGRHSLSPESDVDIGEIPPLRFLCV